MQLKNIIVASIATTGIGFGAQSCLNLATSDIGMSVIKQVLLGGISKGVNTFQDKNAFLQNDLIVKALPENLKSIYNTLNKISPNLTNNAKNFVADAAAYTVNISEPILKNAVNGLTADDVKSIANGGKGALTQLLKQKTANQIIAAIEPKVAEKLNENSLVKNLNKSMLGNSILGNLLGKSSSGSFNSGTISHLASEQLVNGFFNIVQDHEEKNSMKWLDALQKFK